MVDRLQGSGARPACVDPGASPTISISRSPNSSLVRGAGRPQASAAAGFLPTLDGSAQRRAATLLDRAQVSAASAASPTPSRPGSTPRGRSIARSSARPRRGVEAADATIEARRSKAGATCWSACWPELGRDYAALRFSPGAARHRPSATSRPIRRRSTSRMTNSSAVWATNVDVARGRGPAADPERPPCRSCRRVSRLRRTRSPCSWARNRARSRPSCRHRRPCRRHRRRCRPPCRSDVVRNRPDIRAAETADPLGPTPRSASPSPRCSRVSQSRPIEALPAARSASPLERWRAAMESAPASISVPIFEGGRLDGECRPGRSRDRGGSP